MNKSFTLIEILVVIVVIGVLSAFILVGMSSISSKANIAKSQAFINSMDNSLLLARVSQWKFDELTSAPHNTPIVDYWGSNAGTLSTGDGTVDKLRTDCSYGKCIYFDGLDDYIDCGSGSTLNISNFITISAWVKYNTTTTPFIVWANNLYRFAVGSGHGGYVTTDSVAFIQSGIQVVAMSNQNVITPNIWIHIAYTKNGTGATNKLYINGISTTLFLNTSYDYTSLGTNYIGKYSSAQNFSGLIDDVRIYNQAIPTSEIQQNYFLGLNNLLANNGISEEEYIAKIAELRNNVGKGY
jgi:prepilin-type N-terminal cleavage/methylation domain-containing protein